MTKSEADPAKRAKIVYDAKAETELYAALGRALARWQHVETSLYVLAHALMRTGAEISGITFFHIRSAESKVQLLEKLCRQLLDKNLYQSDWVPLRKDLVNPIDVRNSMAHFEVVWLDHEFAKSVGEHPVMIYAHHLDTYANRKGGRGLNLKSLREADRVFKELAERLIHFVSRVPLWQQQEASLPLRLQQYLQTVRKKGIAPAQPPPPQSPHEAKLDRTE